MRQITILFSALTLATACSRDLTDAVVPVNGVTISTSVTSRAASGDSVAIHIANGGSQTAYLPRCGSGPLLLMQTFTDGEWTGGVQNFMCAAPSTSGPVVLAPGASIDIVRVFSGAGRYRMIAAVAPQESLDGAVTATSNPFDVP